MTTNWTQTAQEICTGALEICEAIGDGEPASASDLAICERALNGILKELPLHGFSWFKITNNDVSISWSALTPNKVNHPADFFGNPVLKSNGEPLKQIAKAEYDYKPAQTATYPTEFYQNPNNAFVLWPTPTQDPVLTLSYQAIVDDVTTTATPDIKQAWLLGFTYWLADEISLKFGVPQATRVEIKQRAAEKRTLMAQWATELAPISIQVDSL